MSNETGQFEIYVKPFPEGEGKWLVSVNGGAQPLWSGNGDELFYVEGNSLMVVQVETQSTFAASSPVKLLTGDQIGTVLYDSRYPFYWMYDVTNDGKRFVVVQPVGGTEPSLMLVENWFAEFKKE